MLKTTKTRLPIVYDNLFGCVENYLKMGHNGTSIIVPHVCNNVDSFGAGFASGVSKYYPIVKQNYHMLGSHFLKNNLGYVQFVQVAKDNTYGHKLIFANMIAQNGTISKTNTRPLNYYALVKCMSGVLSYIKTNFDHEHKVQIHAPKFGSGLAGGDWKFIEDLIIDIWSGISVIVYDIRKSR